MAKTWRYKNAAPLWLHVRFPSGKHTRKKLSVHFNSLTSVVECDATDKSLLEGRAVKYQDREVLYDFGVLYGCRTDLWRDVYILDLRQPWHRRRPAVQLRPILSMSRIAVARGASRGCRD